MQYNLNRSEALDQLYREEQLRKAERARLLAVVTRRPRRGAAVLRHVGGWLVRTGEVLQRRAGVEAGQNSVPGRPIRQSG